MLSFGNDIYYRECVGIMLLSREDKVFVGSRIDVESSYWQMPQGGIEEGEDYTFAMKRELFEETSISNIEVIREMDHWLYYDVPEKLRQDLWGGLYRGQKQRWFQCLFCGDDEEINIATSDPEFRSWKWQDRDKVVSEAIPFKKELYQKVIDYFANV